MAQGRPVVALDFARPGAESVQVARVTVGEDGQPVVRRISMAEFLGEPKS